MTIAKARKRTNTRRWQAENASAGLLYPEKCGDVCEDRDVWFLKSRPPECNLSRGHRGRHEEKDPYDWRVLASWPNKIADIDRR